MLKELLTDLGSKHQIDLSHCLPRILRPPWIDMEAIWLNTDSLRILDRFLSRLDELENSMFIEDAVQRTRQLIKS